MSEEKTTLWVAGKVREHNGDEGVDWEILGVFSTEEKAVAACKTTDDFVAPVTLDEDIGQDKSYWPDCYYPMCVRTVEGTVTGEAK